MNISEIAKQAHNNAVKRNFYGNDPEQAIKDKLDEELDELKTALYCKDFKPFPMLPDDDEQFIFVFERFIKDTVGAEYSDLIITALSSATEHGIPIELYIKAGLRYNKLRRY